jgi:hypothetical protein
MTSLRTVLLGVVLWSVAGCSSFGPTTIPRDRFDYSGALAESWKNQMLLNLVKMRYLDLPIYLEVGQIVSGYTVQTDLTAAGQVARHGQGDTFFGLGARGTYTDRPTITYAPLTGQKFLESFLTPVHPARVLSLVQAGFAADFILELSLDSLNGLRNRPVTLGAKHRADREFFRALALLREIQDAGAVGVRVEHPENAQPATVLFFRRDRIPPDVLAKIEEVRGLLGLTPSRGAFRLVQSPLPGGPGELAIATRSLMQVLAALALGVEIPPEHRQRRLTPTIAELAPSQAPLLRVHSGSGRPADPFVAVSYEEVWFWIANDDWRSKRTFTSILFLFTLADTGGAQAPVLTIPTQ